MKILYIIRLHHNFIQKILYENNTAFLLNIIAPHTTQKDTHENDFPSSEWDGF